jgi:dihydrofolate synthase/folylpolyglutamate synthase
MNYSECTAYLDRLGNEVLAMKFGLDTIRELLCALDSPESRYPSVLVAGTNGKGSVARFISSICTESGLDTGLFTSPHLISVTERIQLNGQSIAEEEFAQQFTLVTECIASLRLETHPTFFETITATALSCFSERNVDLAILEVGLGGRLDSTNAVEPILSVLTEISYDHQQYLGNTLSQIATEKAGIMRSSRPTVSAPQLPEVRQTIHDHARRIGSPLKEVSSSLIQPTGSLEGCYSFAFRGQDYQLSTCGQHQLLNATLALEAAEQMRSLGVSITHNGILEGIQKTRVPGVVQRLEEHPQVFLDGAHNPGAVASLVRFLELHSQEPRTLVFAIMKDKMIEEVLVTLARPFQRVLLTQIPSPRAATAEELKRIYPAGEIVIDPFQAYRNAIQGVSTAVVAGSFHLVGEILKRIGGR